ncbi:hypothetical protein HMN09_00836500 [Mycena chlorophos]|uniref:Phosphatidylglycerol/phosphatidylinositol transfer protein n=1 Tax=Mycena chlorophos TaxID=658473 RepID=A0A8H6STC3_MYCCL|nr:hypothetical protein HMN09_00836500 [Mycena chlorophos]
MKLLASLAAFACLLPLGALAQNTAIGYPPANTTVSPGSNITVEVDRPNSLTGSQEVAAVLGVVSCAGRPVCPDPTDVMGSILYSGPFNPQYQTNAQGLPPHQNFTVTIPATIAKGPAQLNLAHFSLVGAGFWPYLETHNISLFVV